MFENEIIKRETKRSKNTRKKVLRNFIYFFLQYVREIQMANEKVSK